MARIFQLPQQVPIVGGEPSPGAMANFYLTGTTTPTDTYTDDALTTPHANPVVADAAGVFPVIYLDPDIVYRLVLNNSDTTLIYDEDPIQDSLTQANIGLIFYPRNAAEISAGVTPVNYFMNYGNVLRYGTNTTPGTTDMTAAIQAAIDSSKNVFIPEGTYLILSALLPRTQQTIRGSHTSASVIKAGSSGMTMLNYPSGAYSGVNLRDFKLNGDNLAANGISIIGSSQGAVSFCELRKLEIAICTSRQLDLSNVTYFTIANCAANGGTHTVYMDDCFESQITENSIIRSGSTASLAILKGAQITVSDAHIYNDVGSDSTQLLLIDGSYANKFVDTTFEPQGTSNVTNEVTLQSTLSTTCTENSFNRCRFIGLPGTKTNCVDVGKTGNAFKTRFNECGFIKPTSTSSVLLTNQAETILKMSYDLAVYSTATYSEVTITNNSGNPFYEEKLPGQFFDLNVENIATFEQYQVFSGTPPSFLEFSTAPTNALINAAASGDGGLIVSSDGMFRDPETDTEAGYIKVRINGTVYQVPIYVSA